VSITGTVLSAFLRAGDGTVYTGTAAGDLYVGSARATSFEHRIGPHLRCLGQRAGTARIYGCGDGSLDGFNLGYSDDGAHTFKPLLGFSVHTARVALITSPERTFELAEPAQISGPLTCPPVPSACAAHWANLQQVLGITTPDAGASSGGSAKSSGGGHCASLGASGGGLLVLITFAAWRRRRRSRVVGGRDAASVRA
jgi:hypothetical protein